MNNYRIRLDQQTKGLEVPINLAWDLNGINESIDIYESDILKQIINPIDDFETIRYSHKIWNDGITNKTKTSTNYEFYFYSATTDSNITGETNNNNWVTDYRANGLTTREVLFQDKVYTSSFFKLDFYDTKDSGNQQIYLTIIIPTRQGETMQVPYGVANVDIKKPVFKLDFVGDKEGYFIYWLKDTQFVNLKTLYMSGKFYDAKIGQFKRLMTQGQGVLSEKFKFNPADYFYYTVNLDYTGYTYDVSLTNSFVTNMRVGTENEPIKWYEYINPPAPPVGTPITPTPTPSPTKKSFQLKRCGDGKVMYGTDNIGLGTKIGDFVKITGGANSGCWEVISTSTTLGAAITAVFTDCSCTP